MNIKLIDALSCSQWVITHIGKKGKKGQKIYFLQSLDYWDNYIQSMTGKTIFEWYEEEKEKIDMQDKKLNKNE